MQTNIDGKILLKHIKEGQSIKSLCKEYGLPSYEAFYKLVEPLGYVKKSVAPTVRPRKLKTWAVKNRTLDGVVSLLVAAGKSRTKIAQEIRVDLRTLQRWIYEGSIPPPDSTGRVCAYFGKSPEELFGVVLNAWGSKSARPEWRKKKDNL